MAAKYDHLMDDRIPLQRCAKTVKALLLSRLYIMVLHRYHISVVSPMPDRLRDIMLAAGITSLETAVALDTLPELRNWAWYGGALQQYHTACMTGLLCLPLYSLPASSLCFLRLFEILIVRGVQQTGLFLILPSKYSQSRITRG